MSSMQGAHHDRHDYQDVITSDGDSQSPMQAASTASPLLSSSVSTSTSESNPSASSFSSSSSHPGEQIITFESIATSTGQESVIDNPVRYTVPNNRFQLINNPFRNLGIPQLTSTIMSDVEDPPQSQPDSSSLATTTTTLLPERDVRQCWVCLQAEDENGADCDWVQPCRCRGSSKYVHQNCIQLWIDEKQKYSSGTKVSCPQCKTEYVLIFPPFRGLVCFLEFCDVFLYQAAPYACGTMFLGSIYWLSLSYGAVTVLQVMGLPEGKEALQQTDTLWLLTGLPCIPVALIAGKFIGWEHYLLQFWRRHYRSIPFFEKIFGLPPSNQRENSNRILSNRDTSHPVSCTRLFTGALLLPTVSSFIGRYLFPGVASHLQRTLLGGFTFIVVKGFLKIYLRHQQYIRQSNRKIVDFKESVPSTSGRSNTSTQTDLNEQPLEFEALQP